MTQREQRAMALRASNRFGYGPQADELERIGGDAKGWLKAQLEPGAPETQWAALPSTNAMFWQEEAWRLARTGIADEQARRKVQQAQNKVRNQHRLIQAALRLQQAAETERPFRERLVRFWSNHFSVAMTKQALFAVGAPYEHEAIRRNMDGDFATLLLAAEQHPAMLIYLDNDLSTGPNSTAGKAGKRGLNENLGREIMELHTLSVNGGYTQADVTSLATLLTGWGVARRPSEPNLKVTRQPGDFQFAGNRHEPGEHTLLGKSYKATGLKQGEQALHDLARHPATAHHIATKLVRHFVADTPPPAAVEKIEQVFKQSEGHLPTVHAALVDLPQAWQAEHKKLKTPEELLISTTRLIGTQSYKKGNENIYLQLARLQTALNQQPFAANSPQGWPDNAAHWGSPAALLKRVEWANTIAAQSPATLDAMQLYTARMPENERLQQAIARSESRAQGLALLLASPDWQWR